MHLFSHQDVTTETLTSNVHRDVRFAAILHIPKSDCDRILAACRARSDCDRILAACPSEERLRPHTRRVPSEERRLAGNGQCQCEGRESSEADFAPRVRPARDKVCIQWRGTECRFRSAADSIATAPICQAIPGVWLQTPGIFGCIFIHSHKHPLKESTFIAGIYIISDTEVCRWALRGHKVSQGIA